VRAPLAWEPVRQVQGPPVQVQVQVQGLVQGLVQAPADLMAQ